jgi:hypothetical protein
VKRIWITLLLILLALPVYSADTKISALPDGGATVAGASILPGVVAGATSRFTIAQLFALGISDIAYGAWSGVTTIAPSKNAVYDKIESVISGYPTAASIHFDDVLTALGIASTAVNFGAFTGSTIADNVTAKAALQALETAVELRAVSSTLPAYTQPGTNLPICRTGAGTMGGCTNITDIAAAPIANPVFTGVVDIPTDATTDAAGEVTIDLTTDQLRFYGGAARALPSVQYASFVIPAPVAADDILIMKAPYGMTIIKTDCIVQGTTSVHGQLQECDAAGANCADTDSTDDITCDADGAADDGTLSNASIDSGDWIMWKTTSIADTPTFLTVTFTYYVVAD